MFKVTIGNSKLNTICQINLPAILSCREDAPCKKQCYVRRGCYNYPNIKNIYQENLETFLNNPSQAEEDILNQLPLMGFCRIHSSGDFYNEEYFKMILRITKKKKKVYFLAFTKKYEKVSFDDISGIWQNSALIAPHGGFVAIYSNFLSNIGLC